MSLRQRPRQSLPESNPSKLFYRIGEVSRITGLEPYVLRYWETEFPHLRPEKRKSGQRLYTRKDLENILQVKQLLYRDGFTISGARKKIRGRSGRDIGDVLEKAKREIRELLELLKEGM
jgi:DNA-binding transcriptional MerR regulator